MLHRNIVTDLILVVLILLVFCGTLRAIAVVVYRLRIAWSLYQIRRSYIKFIRSLTPEQLEIMKEAAAESGLTIERVAEMLGVEAAKFDADIKCERGDKYDTVDIELKAVADPVEARVMLDPESAAREHAEHIDREIIKDLNGAQ